MRYLLIVFGIISLVLGVAGIFLPLLPTTPFLLLSAFLFARSSPKLHVWLLNHKILGKYIRDFLQERAVPLRVKIISISMLWTAIIISTLFAASGKLWLQILLCVIVAGVTAHILKYKTK